MYHIHRSDRSYCTCIQSYVAGVVLKSEWDIVRISIMMTGTFHPRNHFPHFFDRNAEELSKFGLLLSHYVVGQPLYSANIINTLIAVKVYQDVLPVPY